MNSGRKAKIALITGVPRRIGRAVAGTFAVEGSDQCLF
jgi:NAD(P)-dependent dehydrogenase (short-subunit alcohol dehydrogenase family)